jgi:hypothetical protein
MNLDALYAAGQHEVEDFWGRRNRLTHQRDFRLFGRPANLASNSPGAMDALDASLALFSLAAPVEAAPFAIEIVVRPMHAGAEPLPANLFDQITYTGRGNWLALHLGDWGHCHVDLSAGRATAVVATELGQQPAALSRYLLNTILTNLIIGRGYGMLHATALQMAGRVLLLLAPHNSGKSTTALRLVQTGYTFLSDSMVFIAPPGRPLQLLFFPVGKLKVRPDVIPHFPALAPFLEQEMVRGEVKHSLDLRRATPALVGLEAIEPASVDIFLLNRWSRAESRVEPATATKMMAAAVANSIYYDRLEAWRPNLALIWELVQRARCYRLFLGADEASLVTALAAL